MIKITVGKVAVSLAAAVAAVTLTPVPASAALTGCILSDRDYPYSTYPGATTNCTGGTGSYRVWITCWNDYNKSATYYGPWETPARYSTKDCNSTYPHRGSYGRQTQ